MTTTAPAGEGGGGTSAEQAPTSSAGGGAPSQHPPPSPLSGCYLLVVLPEPHTAQHKDLILNRLAKGFLSWDKDSCHVDLEKELQALVAQSPEGEEARNGERLIQYATENLVTEVLIYPQSNTLLQCIRNLLASFTKHRHIIHAGYTFGGNGSWILQDGTFSLADFLDAFSEHEVQRVLRAYENSVTVDIHCAGVGDWTTSRLSKEACTRACRVRVNPDDVLTAGVSAITSFTNYIGQYLIAQTLDQLMEPSDVVGNIRFSHPTLYVFPGGQGDAALFGINGFNMLVDGGFARKACFWDFTRHLDRLDAVLVTRINNSNVGGMSSVLKKKKEMHVYPQIGHFFCNLVERRHSNSPDGDKDLDPLILNLIDIGQEMMANLRHINLRPHPCYRDTEPINLYHKVGHGTLDMYVLSPSKDSREVREFLAKWNNSDAKLFAGSHRKDSSGILFPAQNLVSICALLVWQPANPEDTITRILFPGSTPQHKIFEGFERLKHLEFLKHPTCTAKSLSPSTSLLALKDKAAILKPKLSSIERETKRLAETRREKRDVSEIKAVRKDTVDDASTKISAGKPSAPPQIKSETKARKVVENKKIESEAKESKKIEKELKETKKEAKKVEKSEQPESDAKKTDAVKVETEKTAPAKEPKTQKIDVKRKDTKEITRTTIKPSKPESMTKPSTKPVEKKPKPSGEKKDIMKPSPTTPKKSMNGAATKTEVSKSVAKAAVKPSSKISTAAPAKSAKDANNRMVVEQKNIESAAASAATKAPAKPKPIDRKPISRRAKPVSPSKARLPISPAKSTRSTPTASVKSEKDAVIRKVKGGTTDSSAVSTPSGIEPESAIKLIDKNLTEKSEDMSLDSIESKVLADLKEEREVVEEIEAVLQKAERIEEARKEERFEGDDEITAEATDKKEEDMTEEDVTAEMDDAPKKLSRKESQELTEEDEYLIVEKEEIYTEDSIQSGDTEQKHHLDEAESEKSKMKIGKETEEEEEEEHEEEKEEAEEKKDEVPEKSLVATTTEGEKRKSMDLSPEHKELLKEEMKQIIASATEAVQKTEEKDDSGKKDSEDITKDPSSLSPDKLDSSVKPDADQKEIVPEKLEESQERISTLESGATTTAPTLPEDERIPLDEIKEDVDEKHVLEEVKEKEIPIKEKEVIPEVAPTVSKPEVKVLDVKPPVHHGIARDVVKTPDEVADLPVHEEVDPKLYRMDEPEKDKETKAPAPAQVVKEPVVQKKEQKDNGVFSFFGKVADKFEKGIDKLKKVRRDSMDKEVEEKSSKSSSPKEPKPQENIIFEDVDVDKVFPKVGKHEEKVDISHEKIQPEVSDIKVTSIEETTSLLPEDKKESVVTAAKTTSDEIIDKATEEKLDEQVIEDIEEVEALVEEASKKFKNVKDSLQDSLESLEEKADEAKKAAAASVDKVKDTLVEAAEKLDDIKSDVSDIIASKEPEKVKFIIPSSDDTEKDEDDSDGIVRDFKEAVRDVAEVLVGTAGIEIEKEEKPKDVEQIVKKVAEVLKDDDFLTEKTLFSGKDKEKDESLKSPAEELMIPKKVGITEEIAPQEEVEEIPELGAAKRLSTDYQKADGFEVHEEPFIKVQKDKLVTLASPTRDSITDKEDALRICDDLLKCDILEKPIGEEDTQAKVDVMDCGLEEVCVKKVCKRELYDEESPDEKIILEPEIGFDQKLSPGKAELVTVTPGSTPTSPKLTTDMELPELPAEYKSIFNKETSLENSIEEFIAVKKHKVTMQVIEYIVIVRHVPKEKVINVIQETIIRHKIPRDSVTDSVEVLRSHDISAEKRLEIQNHITNEYLNKNKKITLNTIEEISMTKIIPKCVVIQIVEEIIVNKRISRESVFDIPEESYFTILREIDDTTKVSIGIDEKDDEIVEEDFVHISSADIPEMSIEGERKKSLDKEKFVQEEDKVSDSTSIPSTEKSDAHKITGIDEAVEPTSEIVEDDEKFVKDTPEKSVKDVSEDESKEGTVAKVGSIQDRETSEVSEIDTNEKYLDEAKEKTIDKKESEAPKEALKETHTATLVKSHADATGRSGGFIDVTDIVQAKDDDELQEADKESHDGTVKRMVVTASSEDGGHEIEICPSGTITFTKSSTPEDSLKELDAQSTFEKDSLAKSTPEKDISEKPSIAEVEIDALQRKESKASEINLKESVPELDAKKSVEAVDQLSSIISSTEMVKTPDSLHSGDASPAESVFSKSPTEKASAQATELFSHENLIAEKLIDDLTAVAEKSKSPSTEKDSVTGVSDSKLDAKSKSPSPDKEVEKKDLTPDVSTKDKIDDRSKSPSIEKETSVKEKSPELKADIKADDKSKSPSPEKADFKKETSQEPEEIKIDEKSKSPSIEKEIAVKEKSPELKTDNKADDRSKSPSLEKEVSNKEASQEPEEIKSADRSKSPSLEKDVVKADTATDVKIDDTKSVSLEHVRSKSPSVEKESEIKSKSPSPEKDATDKEKSPELKSDDKSNERSKSPSIEKDVTKELSLKTETKLEDRSKSPSTEKELDRKESLSIVDVKIDARLKSPTDEDQKESSSVLGTKSPSAEKETANETVLVETTMSTKVDSDGTKPSSHDKDRIEKEKSPEGVVDISLQKSKSPSPEKEDGSLETTTQEVVKEESKLLSSEKVETTKEEFPEVTASEIDTDRSKSPSVEKDVTKQDISLGLTKDVKVDVRSESPSVEKETDKKEMTPELSVEGEVKEQSKSPSIEKDSIVKETSPEIVKDGKTDDKLKSPSPENDVVQDKSKSPSPEKPIVQKVIASELFAEDKVSDESELSSLEKHDLKKETSPQPTVDTEAKGRSKSPSVEKETDKKETSSVLASDAKSVDKSKSPSPEKEVTQKEASPELVSDVGIADKSKASSVERDDLKKDITQELLIDTQDKLSSSEKDISEKEISTEVTTELKTDDTTKSPSVEKDTKEEKLSESDFDTKASSKSPSLEKEKEKSPELIADTKVDDRSKSPSLEKDVTKTEKSPESVVDAKADDRSKSPSPEKDTTKKEKSPELVTDAKADDRSKSPSPEKDATKKEKSPELVAETKADDKSKSPSPEKDIAEKEKSPELVADTKADDKSKSLSPEKDIAEKEKSPELAIGTHDDIKAKSPSPEKDTAEKEKSPELDISVKTDGISKSPSPEKDMAEKEKSSDLVVDTKADVKSKSPTPEKDTVEKDKLHEVDVDTKIDDRSKSPSPEKDAAKKEKSPELAIDTKDDIKSKSPSPEKDAVKKEKSPELAIDTKDDVKSKSPTPEKDTVEKEKEAELVIDAKTVDGSKSPSLEKDATKKDKSPELVVDAKADDRSKSPSPEKDVAKKEESPELIADAKVDDRSKSPSLEKDRSKSPSPEKDVAKKEESPELIADAKADDRSKSPSPEKDVAKKEESPELIADAKVDDRSKSPSLEKDVTKTEKSPELVADAKADDKSKSPSPEKDVIKKEKSPELVADATADDRSKSPSPEKDATKKEKSPELVTDAKADDRSKSPSPEKDATKKEKSPELVAETKADDKSSSLSPEKDIAEKEKSPELEADTKADDKSKSPSSEKDTTNKEKSPELVAETKVDAERSKSLSIEKDSDQAEIVIVPPVDGYKSSGIEEDVKSLSDYQTDKSKLPSIELDLKVKDSSSEKLPEVTHTDGRSKSPSTEKNIDVDRSKSPSLEKEKIESRSSIASDKIDDLLDRKLSISHESDKTEESRSKRASVSDDKVQKSRSPSISGEMKSEVHDTEKSKSISPVSEKAKADVSLLDTVDDRKSSIASIESHTEEKGKDRSRSHSLFETGDKTPIVRSRAASLYEDKIVEKLGVLEHAKDLSGQTHGIFEETEEMRLSHEAIDQLHTGDSKEESVRDQDLTPETRKAIEDYIFSEYVKKKKLITLVTIQEISTIYKIDQDTIVRIINEIISNENIKRKTIVDFDDNEYEEANQKLLEDEEKLTDYINDEFISKKKKIDSKTVDTIASAKSVSRHLVILVIENIITSSNRRRESIVGADFPESHDSHEKEESHFGTDIASDKVSSSRKESISDNLKLSVDVKSMSPSPELEPSLAYKSDRPDPHIDEEITISENKRIEVESLLIDEYVTRGIKITEPILEQIVMKTSLPKYIIIEIIEEILIKKHLSQDAIADKSIFHDDDDDSQHKLEYEHGTATPETGERKSSGYSTPDTRNYQVGLEKGQYTDYESPFHKAFMGGMTEIRTTHITTLSGKSTPDFGQRTETPESISETTDNAKTTITSVPGKIESTTGDDSHQISSESQSKTEETVHESVTKEETHSQLPSGETLVVLKTTQILTYPEETTEITKQFITHESKSDDDPARKDTIEQDHSDSITKIIKHEISHVTEPIITTTRISSSDFNQEFITKEITKTITSGKEIDPASLFDIPGTTSVRKSIDHTETSSVPDSKAADKPSTVSPGAINIEEKLISLESQASDASKKSISSVSSHDSKTESTIVHEEKHTTFSTKDLMDHTIPEQLEQSTFPLIRDLITDDKSCSGKSSPDVSLPKDIVYGGSTGKSTPDISMSPLIRDGSMMQSHLQSGRSTPDRRSDRGSRTATPEGFRSGDVIRTIITTTRTMSDDGEIITTTQEVTEATNEKGETVVLAEKTDVKVDERLPETKPIDIQRAPSASSDKEVDPTSPRSDLSSGHSRAATHMWGSSDERHTYSDEDQPSPPFSSSPYHPDSAVKEGTFKTPDDFSSAAMSSSFYGELPEESIHFHTSTLSKTVEQVLPEGEPDEFSFKKFTVEKEFTGGYSDKDSKKYVDEADLDFEKALTGDKSEHDRGHGSSVLGASGFSTELEKSSDPSKSGPADDKKDPLAGWGSPLGLPSPKAPRKFNLRSPIQPCSSADLSPDSLNFDVINDWGEPMRLPSPAPTTNEVSNKGSPGTPKKEKKQTKKVLSENIKNKKRSESPNKNDKRMKDSKNKVQPVYVDLTYVSHHGNSFYTALEFFKKVRARYYVFSGTEPSREVYDALLEAKKTWEDKDLEVTMIPTYDTDTLGYWVADNEEALAAHHIDLSPSASRCTINLQDHETSCSAYRLEF